MGSGDITSIIQSIGNVSDKIIVQLIMGYLDSIGFFALPIINQITEYCVAQFVDLIVNKLELVTINIVTVIETAGQESDFVKAAQANAEAQINGQNQDKAKQDLLDAARKFYKFSPP